MNLRNLFVNKTEVEGDTRPEEMEDEILIRIDGEVIDVQIEDDQECDCEC